MEVNYYVNLTNGIEAIPALCDVVGTGYKFIRIQSTSCERHMWDKLIQDLDYDFLMNLALGIKDALWLILVLEKMFQGQFIKG